MYELRRVIVVVLLLVGCNAETVPPPADVHDIDNVLKFIDEKDPWTKYYNAWDFVKTQAKLKHVTSHDPPVFLELRMAKVATDWSTAEAVQFGSASVQEYELDLNHELFSFVFFSMPWEPVKIREWMLIGAAIESGETGMLEWKSLDKSDGKSRRIELWFRMKSQESFVSGS